MIWLILAGGRGSRTQLLGEFKPFIEVRGQKIISWLLFSIGANVKATDKFIFVTTGNFSKKYNFKDGIQEIFTNYGLDNDFEIFTSKDVLPGNSCSAYLAKSSLSKEEPATILCCDQFTDFQLPPEIPPFTGYLTVGLDFGSSKGYVEIKEGLIQRFAEKEPISNFASSGIYIVSSGMALIFALERQFRDKAVSTNGEYCLGPAFNYLIEDGYKIYPLLANAHYSLGSISAINYFSSSAMAIGLSGLMAKENPRAR